MAQLSGGLPAVGGIDGAGLCNDGGHLLVGADGRGHGLAVREPLGPFGPLLDGGEGELALIEDLIQDQAHGVGIHRGVQGGVGIGHLGGGVDAAVALGQGGVGQHIHRHKAQVADAVLLILEHLDVLGLQVHIQPSGLPAHGQGGAHIDAQVDGAQMGHGAALQMTVEGLAVAAQQDHVVADALLHRLDLMGIIGHKTSLPRQGLQGLDFLPDALGQFLVICADGLGIPEDAGQKQGFDLDLGGGEGDLLHNISFFRVIPHGRIAGDAAVLRDRLTQGEAVQQRGYVSGF